MLKKPSNKNSIKINNFFPMSVWYSGGKARAPMLSEITKNSPKEWRKDLQQIKLLGFNTVRTWVEWAKCEPSEGDFNFDNLKLLSELANEEGLKVIIQMYVDSAPDWVGRLFPDALFEAQSGEKVPSQAAPGFCVDHEGVNQAVLNFYSETAKVAVQYPNFFGWDIWSEPHIINWAIINYVPNAQFCYCPHTQNRFREWLKAKYKYLEILNQAWYRNFESWEDVEPPRFGTILSYTDFIDWKNFIYKKIAQDLKSRYDAIRKIDKTHIITSHAAVPSVFTKPQNGEGEADDFLMADQVDFYGTSLYPKHSFPNTHWERWKLLLAIDFSRSANIKNGGFYVGELQAGYGTRGLIIGDPVTAEDHRTWIWSAIAGGSKGINLYAYYPMSSGYESSGYGLIHLDGKLTDRAKESGKIAEIIDKNKELFTKSTPLKAQIAIVYNPLSQMIGGEQHCGPENGLRDSMVGYWWALRQKNIPVDFIHRRDIESCDISNYKLIILPYPVLFTKEASEGLKKFVENGGCVVAEARLGWNDERGFAAEIIPGMGLHEVFGVREEKTKMGEQIEMKVSDNPNISTAHIQKGKTLIGTLFAESINPLEKTKTNIIARFEDNSPAIIESKFGKGKTLFIGTFLGLAAHQNPCEENTKFIQSLIDWAEIKYPFSCTLDKNKDCEVEIRIHEVSDGYILFIINHDETQKKFTFYLEAKQKGEYFIHNITENTQTKQLSKNRNLEFDIDIKKKDVIVFHIK